MSTLMRHTCLAAICLSAWAVGLSACRAGPPQSQPERKVVATVNGESILESELLAALPDDSFDASLDDAKKIKLARLVETTFREQFLKGRKVDVPEQKVDEGLKKFEEMVKTPGCPCCGGGYANLDQFMQVSWFTMAELRRRVRNETGYQFYYDKLVAEGLTPEVVKSRRPAIEKDFVKGAVIFFDFWEDPQFYKDHKAAEARVEAAATAAWKRLQKGESFDAVAKNPRGDSSTGDSGIAPTCYQLSLVEDEIKAQWLKLAPGEHSPLFKTTDGFRIIRREPLTEQDVLRLLKNQIAKEVQQRIQEDYSAMRAKAKIEFPTKPAAGEGPSVTPKAAATMGAALVPPADGPTKSGADRQQESGRESGL